VPGNRDPQTVLRAARLYLIIECEVGGVPAAEVAAAAIRGGVDIVQLRDKRASDERILAVGRGLCDACEALGALFVMNDRPDLALACGADGVHIGQNDARVEEVRGQVGDRLLIGISTHSRDQIAAAERSAADYMGVGPVFETPTKPGRPAVGLELVEYAAGHASKPWFAIGGIDAQNAPAVVAAGAGRLAVVRAIRDAADPEQAARALRAALRERAGVGSPG
jgi:thiamine-phosphate pyrophosphorylase